MSDLHIDLNQFGEFEIETLLATLKEEKIDHLHLAGDISNHHYDISLPFLEKIAEQVDLTYNLGNHDMLDINERNIIQHDFQKIPLGKRTLLAFHGWYDYSFVPEKSPEDNLRFKNTFWFDRRLNRPLSDPAMTKSICQRLDNELAQLDTPLVAMHFVPHQQFTLVHDKFKPFNAFLGSQNFHEIFQKHNIKDVVFGHAHRSYGTQNIDGINYHSRPLGYVREWDLTIDYVKQHPELNPSGTWNLSRRYNLVRYLPDFQDYKHQQLATEFRQSMTIFDIWYRSIKIRQSFLWLNL